MLINYLNNHKRPSCIKNDSLESENFLIFYMVGYQTVKTARPYFKKQIQEAINNFFHQFENMNLRDFLRHYDSDKIISTAYC